MSLTDDPIIRELSAANPVADDDAYEPSERQRVLDWASAGHSTVVSSRGRVHTRRLSTVVAAGASALVVAVVVVVVALAGHQGSSLSTTAAGGHSMVARYRVEPAAAATEITPTLIKRDRQIIAERVHLLASTPVQVTLVRVSSSDVALSLRSQKLTSARLAVLGRQATVTGALAFYDWEADVLLPGDKTVAAQQPNHSASAAHLSQGGRLGPGAIGGGGMTLYEAVKLASQQPPRPAAAPATLSHIAAQYYAFGAPGSGACRTAAQDTYNPVTSDTHCYLAGPASSRSALRAQLPPNVSISVATVLKIPQGTTLLQASGQAAVNPTSPTARYFVLRDRVALSGTDITHPHTSTDSAGQPDVEFDLTGMGARRFQALTATVAHRGTVLSTGVKLILQHFAVALDSRIISVPGVDPRQYPDGIITQPGTSPHHGVQIAGLSTSQARQITIQLRTGTLPLTLTPVDQTP